MAFNDANLITALGNDCGYENWIAKDKAEREFWAKLKGDAIRWVLFAVAGWAGLALWSASRWWWQSPGDSARRLR